MSLSMMTGCSNPCGDLEDICDTCDEDQEPGQRAVCDALIAADDKDACDAALDEWDELCN
jgi:hypothetical protein